MDFKKYKYLVLYGGWSEERDISIKSGLNVYKEMRKHGFNVVPFDLRMSNIEELKKYKERIFFIALHGRGGEDGFIQSYLDSLGIKYTGSGAVASMIAMNKVLTKIILKNHGIKTPEWFFYNEPVKNFSKYVVKPVDSGSTIGVSIVTKSGIKHAVKNALKFSKDVFIEEFIDGKELTAAIAGDRVFSPLEIIPKHRYYDYYSKYSPHGSIHIKFEAEPSIIERIKKTSWKIFKILGLKSVARVDYRLKDELYFLEVNTIPGLTSTSLLPHAAGIDGYEFIDVIKMIIKASIED